MKSITGRNCFLTVFILILFTSCAFCQSGEKLKVFISVDMEGITGVVHWEEVSRKGKDYDYFRKIMTLETNAAIQGALDAGATEILVRDSHGSARNILPGLLNKKAKLLRDWSGGVKSMMEGIDETFDAVLFIGYHAKAGTKNSPLAHTMSGNVVDISINGVSLPEAGVNALIAGNFNVPIAFLSGGREICEQAEGLFKNVETVKVKDGIGTANLNLHPDAAQEKIRAGVKKALKNLKNCRAYKLSAPYTLSLKVKKEKELYKDAKRTGQGQFTYKSSDIMDVIEAFSKMR